LIKPGEKICPVCKREISALAAYCQFCGHADASVKQDLEDESADALMTLLRMVKKDPHLSSMFDKILEKE
jgi:predicted amidophosphoribosyltransferase